MSAKSLSAADAGGQSLGAQTPGGRKGATGADWARWVIAVVIILLVAGYVTVLLFDEELRRDFFIQRLTAPILTLGIAVALFAAVPSSARISATYNFSGGAQKVTWAAGGGLAAFLLLNGPIGNVLFPKDLSINGYIYYQSDGKTQALLGVRDVIVQVPQTDQRSRSTGEDGYFTIGGLSFKPDKLKALYGGMTYNFQLIEPQGGDYPIIPRPAEATPSEPNDIAASEWLDLGNKCPDASTAGYNRVKQLVLQKTLPALPGYRNMIVKVQALDSARIAYAQKELPNSGYDDQIGDGREIARQWSMPVRGDKTEIKLSVCLGVKGHAPAPVRGSLKTQFWFEP
jgi:hypothetical protein